ncbi:hypothetical protein D9M69_666110 [compost metagenome]
MCVMVSAPPERSLSLAVRSTVIGRLAAVVTVSLCAITPVCPESARTNSHESKCTSPMSAMPMRSVFSCPYTTLKVNGMVTVKPFICVLSTPVELSTNSEGLALS